MSCGGRDAADLAVTGDGSKYLIGDIPVGTSPQRSRVLRRPAPAQTFEPPATLRGWHYGGTRVSGRTDRIGERGIGTAADLTATSVAGRCGDGAGIATHNRIV